MMAILKKIRLVPSLGSNVTYEDPDRNECRNAMILSRVGKSSDMNNGFTSKI